MGRDSISSYFFVSYNKQNMTRILFIFMDGIGLGTDDPEINPLARTEMPFLGSLLGGQKLTASAAPYESENVSLLALDAGLGVDGLPQSATGQAVLMTGINIPAELGYHYGPKPNPAGCKLSQKRKYFVFMVTRS
jgi:2,3-bisphosphoglycerate-independent phosphoglycerate mutase